MMYRCPHCHEAAGRVLHATTKEWECYSCDKPYTDAEAVPDPTLILTEVMEFAEALSDWYGNGRKGPRPLSP